MKYMDIINFWFTDLEESQWFKKDNELDELINKRFLTTYWAAVAGELHQWRSEPLGRLAEILILDQFSRNIFRNSPQAFTYDPLALCLAQNAVDTRDDQKLNVRERGFLYMPYMHSESKFIHVEALRLFDQPGLESKYKYEISHKDIIDRFGRYPHRNELLNRTSSREEIKFLQQPGSSF